MNTPRTLHPAGLAPPAPEDEARASDLTRDGYLIMKGAVPADLIAAARRDLAPLRIFDRTSRLQDGWRFSPAIRAVACHQPVLDVLYDLFGRTPIPFQTLNFKHGTEQRPHRDDIHFDTVPCGLMCGVWVAFEPVDETSGPLRYFPGSHERGLVSHVDARDHSGRFRHERYEELIVHAMSEAPAQDFLADPGDVLIWDARLVHGGAPVVDRDRTRWSQVTHYFFEDCVYTTPIGADPRTGTIRLREPLIDIRTGRAAPQVHQGRPARFHRVASGRSHLLEVDDPRPALLTSAASAVRGVTRRTRYRVATRRATRVARRISTGTGLSR